jgi:hypothetical protein
VRDVLRALVLVGSGLLVGLAIAAVLVVRANGAEGPLTFEHGEFAPEPRVKVIRVERSDDAGKAGSVRGVMGQRWFTASAGVPGLEPSDEQLRLVFSAPAEIVALDLSVDINDPRLTLVEFAVALNAADGWGWDGREFDRRADWLLMASWSANPQTHGAIDESVALPEGVQVAAGEFVALTGWLGSKGAGSPVRVSPELIVLYRWL